MNLIEQAKRNNAAIVIMLMQRSLVEFYEKQLKELEALQKFLTQ